MRKNYNEKAQDRLFTLFGKKRLSDIFYDFNIRGKEKDVFYNVHIYDVIIKTYEYEDTELDIFEKAILGLLNIGYYDNQIIEKMCIEESFFKTITDSLKFKGILDSRLKLTSEGLKYLNTINSKEMKYKIKNKVIKVFVDPNSNNIFPYIFTEKDFKLEYISKIDWEYVVDISGEKLGTDRCILNSNSSSINSENDIVKALRKFAKINRNRNYRNFEYNDDEKTIKYDLSGSIYLHLKVALQDGNIDNPIISDGFSSQIEFLHENEKIKHIIKEMEKREERQYLDKNNTRELYDTLDKYNIYKERVLKILNDEDSEENIEDILEPQELLELYSYIIYNYLKYNKKNIVDVENSFVNDSKINKNILLQKVKSMNLEFSDKNDVLDYFHLSNYKGLNSIENKLNDILAIFLMSEPNINLLNFGLLNDIYELRELKKKNNTLSKEEMKKYINKLETLIMNIFNVEYSLEIHLYIEKLNKLNINFEKNSTVDERNTILRKIKDSLQYMYALLEHSFKYELSKVNYLKEKLNDVDYYDVNKNKDKLDKKMRKLDSNYNWESRFLKQFKGSSIEYIFENPNMNNLIPCYILLEEKGKSKFKSDYLEFIEKLKEHADRISHSNEKIDFNDQTFEEYYNYFYDTTKKIILELFGIEIDKIEGNIKKNSIEVSQNDIKIYCKNRLYEKLFNVEYLSKETSEILGEISADEAPYALSYNDCINKMSKSLEIFMGSEIEYSIKNFSDKQSAIKKIENNFEINLSEYQYLEKANESKYLNAIKRKNSTLGGMTLAFLSSLDDKEVILKLKESKFIFLINEVINLRAHRNNILNDIKDNSELKELKELLFENINLLQRYFN